LNLHFCNMVPGHGSAFRTVVEPSDGQAGHARARESGLLLQISQERPPRSPAVKNAPGPIPRFRRLVSEGGVPFDKDDAPSTPTSLNRELKFGACTPVEASLLHTPEVDERVPWAMPRTARRSPVSARATTPPPLTGRRVPFMSARGGPPRVSVPAESPKQCLGIQEDAQFVGDEEPATPDAQVLRVGNLSFAASPVGGRSVPSPLPFASVLGGNAPLASDGKQRYLLRHRSGSGTSTDGCEAFDSNLSSTPIARTTTLESIPCETATAESMSKETSSTSDTLDKSCRLSELLPPMAPTPRTPVTAGVLATERASSPVRDSKGFMTDGQKLGLRRELAPVVMAQLRQEMRQQAVAELKVELADQVRSQLREELRGQTLAELGGEMYKEAKIRVEREIHSNIDAALDSAQHWCDESDKHQNAGDDHWVSEADEWGMSDEQVAALRCLGSGSLACRDLLKAWRRTRRFKVRHAQMSESVMEILNEGQSSWECSVDAMSRLKGNERRAAAVLMGAEGFSRAPTVVRGWDRSWRWMSRCARLAARVSQNEQARIFAEDELNFWREQSQQYEDLYARLGQRDRDLQLARQQISSLSGLLSEMADQQEANFRPRLRN